MPPGTCLSVSTTGRSTSRSGATTSTSTPVLARWAAASSTSATGPTRGWCGPAAGGATIPRPASPCRSTSGPVPGVEGWQVSNPPILAMAPVRVSLALFAEVGMAALRARSVRLTGFLERLLDAVATSRPVTVVTPRDPERRGAQLSVMVDDAVGGDRGPLPGSTGCGPTTGRPTSSASPRRPSTTPTKTAGARRGRSTRSWRDRPSCDVSDLRLSGARRETHPMTLRRRHTS